MSGTQYACRSDVIFGITLMEPELVKMYDGVVVLTKPELVAALQKEVRILLHLAEKVDPSQADYRPTSNQRSTLELLQYLSIMGPTLLRAAKAGQFDRAAWTAAQQESKTRDFGATIAAIAAQRDLYPELLADISDAELREPIEIFGQRLSRGAWIVDLVLCGCAAYRTQIFLYLKACGREELGTSNLWRGVDAAAAV